MGHKATLVYATTSVALCEANEVSETEGGGGRAKRSGWRGTAAPQPGPGLLSNWRAERPRTPPTRWPAQTTTTTTTTTPAQEEPEDKN